MTNYDSWKTKSPDDEHMHTDENNIYDILMLRAYLAGDQQKLDRLYRRSQEAKGERCPDCGGVNTAEVFSQDYFCMDCDYRWDIKEIETT